MTTLWQPDLNFINQSNLYQFQEFVSNNYKIKFNNYHQLWEWSVTNLSDFWESVAIFFKIQFHTNYNNVLQKDANRMIDSIWFEGATLSYSEHIFRNSNSNHPAIIYKNESNPSSYISWNDLSQKVANLQQYFIQQGVTKGDRIVAYLPNTPDAIIAFLACNSLGAIWSCCSPDFGIESIVDRFVQIQPKIFIAADTYGYNGKTFNKLDTIKSIVKELDTLNTTILISEQASSEFVNWNTIISNNTNQELQFTPVPFNHPIWILYSSGTTGKPKAIVHGTGGNLIEHYKALALHQDVKQGERYLWYSTTGWMMWNYSLSSLLVGATLCIYDGAPNFPSIDSIYNFINKEGIHHFGIGAAFHIACHKSMLNIIDKYPLHNLKTIGATGSPLPSDTFNYIYEKIKKDIWLISLSGGTDVCSAFVGGSPFLEVYAGEIQCKMLGAKIEAWNDDKHAVEQELGELMITEPIPSMPVFFWNDTDKTKYINSYFETDTSVWRHGDFIKITENKGIIIYGRSDATLNRDGVRIGTAEVYNALQLIPEIQDSLIVCLERNNGSFFMPLFVVLEDNIVLSDSIKQAIKLQLKTQYSPRHVPDEIYQVSEIPYTISGKKMEMPIKKILMKLPIEKSISIDAMKNPTSLNDFIQIRDSLPL